MTTVTASRAKAVRGAVAPRAPRESCHALKRKPPVGRGERGDRDDRGDRLNTIVCVIEADRGAPCPPYGWWEHSLDEGVL